MNPATNILPEIDFLPAEYREKRVRLQMQPWRLVVSTGLLALVALTAGIQHQRRQHAAEQLASIAPQYEAAASTVRQLQTQLAVARAEPTCSPTCVIWPRTNPRRDLVPCRRKSVWRNCRSIRANRERAAGTGRQDGRAETEEDASCGAGPRALRSNDNSRTLSS